MMLTWQPPEYGCTGLCAGDACAECRQLADRIREAKKCVRGPERDARLMLLGDVVESVMGVRRG